jgi:hypothetical protein
VQSVQQRETKRLANPEAPGWPPDEYSADLGHGADEPVDHGDGTDETRGPANHERLPAALDGGDDDLVILVEGTKLRQGSVYVDLDDLDSGPFRALAGQVARPGQRLVPKHRVGYELWNRLVGQDAEPDVVRPAEDR